MVNKVMKVFYGENCLPYKDKSRTVIYPVIGSSFLGASNTTEIWFYFDKIGEPNNTWVAIAKLPNGKRGAVKLDTFNDTELNEPYAKLQLNTWFTQMRGDVYISLNGYDGGITLSLDQETGLYEVTGTPVIQATGSVKLTIQYATQLIGGDEVDEITLQEIYAMFGEKLDTNKGIVVIANPQVDISEYDVGQYFYSKSDNSVYEKVNNALTLRFTAYSKSESDTLLATKVDKTTDANIVYGTNNNGEQYKVPYSSDYSGKGNNLVQRDSNAQINVPTTPTSNNHSTSKGYVDTQVDTRVAKTNVGDKVYGTDENGNQKTFDVDSDLVSGENGIVVRRLYPNGQVIVGNPIATNHATPKQYVDNNFAHTLDLTIDSNFDLVVKLLNANGVVISQDDVDLPLESIVVSATYYDTYTYQGTTYEKVLVIVLATTNVPTIIPIGDLVSGLVSTDELTTALSGYVEKVAGKGLSTNDFTDAYKNKLDGIESGAEVNVIEEIKVDNVALTPTDKSVNIDLSGKQDTLVSGETIKTMNGVSLLGNGNYTFDTEFSEVSTNALENRVISKEVKEINYEIAVIRESLFETVLTELDYTVDYATTYAIPDTLTDTDGTHRVVYSETELKKIEGNSVAWNQLAKALNANNWSPYSYYVNMSFSNGVCTFKPASGSTYGDISSLFNTITSGNIILVCFKARATDELPTTFDCLIRGTGADQTKGFASKFTTSFNEMSTIFTIADTKNRVQFLTNKEVQIKDVVLINLTKTFPTDTPTTTDDPRVKWAIQYAQEHPEYNENALVSTITTGIESKSSTDTLLGTISVPETELISARNAHNYIEVVEGDIVEGEQLYNLVKHTNVVSINLGSLSWNYGSFGTSPGWYTDVITNLISPSYGTRPNALAEKYTVVSSRGDYFVVGTLTFAYGGVKRIWVGRENDDTTNKPTGYLNYELATPTTEVVATGLHFNQVSSIIEQGGTINSLYEDVAPNITTTFVVKKAVGE